MPSLMLLAATLLAANEKPKLAVLDFDAVGVPKETASALTVNATQELAKRNFFDVITAEDIRTMLGIERQKELMGCNDSSACTAELVNALGSRFVLSGSVSKLGAAFQLSMQVIDTTKGQPIGRAVRLADSPEGLAQIIPWATAEATGTPLPPPPSKALPIAFIATGATSAAIGIVLGINAFSRDFALRDELAQPDTSVFKPAAYYRTEAETIGTLKTISLITVLAGAALVTTGIILYPSASKGGASVAFVPTVGGGALVGVFP